MKTSTATTNSHTGIQPVAAGAEERTGNLSATRDGCQQGIFISH